MTLVSLSNELADAVDLAGAAIVAVHARPRLPSTGVHWRDGIVVTTEGTIKRPEGIEVTLPHGHRVPATLVGVDRGTDLAALRIAPGALAVAQAGDPGTLRPGNLVLALARLDDGGPRASFGAVSATGGRWRCWKGGEIDRWLQSDLTVYPGFGGGPLVDASGKVHGINSGGLSRMLATTIPRETVDRVLDQLLQRGYVARGWLGIAVQPVRFNEDSRKRSGLTHEGGLVVLSVEEDSTAAAAGVLIGDVIVTMDGRAVNDPDQVLEVVAGDAVGKTVSVELVRGGKQVRTELRIGERPRRGR